MANLGLAKNREWDVIQTCPDLVNLLWSTENYLPIKKKKRKEE